MEKGSNPYAILLAGELHVTQRLRAQISCCTVIAADGGIAHAKPLGVKPSLWVGDFDSANEEDFNAFADTARQIHSPQKALSDGELAMNHAIECGATSLLLVGALAGRRTDHMLYHILKLPQLSRQYALPVTATSGTEEAVPLLPDKPLTIELKREATFSVIAFERMNGLTITNAKWPLTDATNDPGETLTLSNQANGPITVSIKSGIGVILFQVESSD